MQAVALALGLGGEAGGFIIEFENGFKNWHMGDTGGFGDMRLIGGMYKPDLVLMPIGGGPLVMNPADAALAARALTARSPRRRRVQLPA